MSTNYVYPLEMQYIPKTGHDVVAWCKVCHAPVVDHPDAWMSHQQRFQHKELFTQLKKGSL